MIVSIHVCFSSVELARVAVADQPILVDITAPFAGIVNDGDTFKTDQQFSKDADKVKYKDLSNM